jgi:hypothetical protein
MMPGMFVTVGLKVKGNFGLVMPAGVFVTGGLKVEVNFGLVINPLS